MVQAIAQMMGAIDGVEAIMPEGVDVSKMMESFPIGRLASFPGMAFGREQVEQLLVAANAQS